MEKTMRTALILLPLAIAGLPACSAIPPKSSAAPPPFECTSIHPEICALEEKFHELRFEQAAQNAAIEAAERKRRAQVSTAGTVAANAVPAS
jgi:hypothetical protein